MTTNADKDAEKLDVSFTAGSTINSIIALKKTHGSPYKTKHTLTIQFGNCTAGYLSQRNENLYSFKICRQIFIATLL